jgi:hypothetical protein
MAQIENTVFISYRRTDVYVALAVYEKLKNQGYDVFFDYTSISSGDFEQIIISNIKARAHFLIILTSTALDRCNEPGDWLRREIETAMDEKRNIVPLLFKGFHFGTPSVSAKLTGKLKNLSLYNGMNVYEDYFDAAMQRLCNQFLNTPLETVLHPVSVEVQKIVREEQFAADRALLLKKLQALLSRVQKFVLSRLEKHRIAKLVGAGIILILVTVSLMVNGLSILDYAPTATITLTRFPTSTPSRTLTPTLTQTSSLTSTRTRTPTSTQTLTSTPTATNTFLPTWTPKPTRRREFPIAFL